MGFKDLRTLLLHQIHRGRHVCIRVLFIAAAILEHRKEKTPHVEAPRAAHCQQA